MANGDGVWNYHQYRWNRGTRHRILVHTEGIGLLKIAVIQTGAGPDIHQNLTDACQLIQNAADSGAQLAILPEMFVSRGQNRHLIQDFAQFIPGRITDALSEISRRHQIWIIGGSIAESIKGESKVYNSCPIIDDSGNLVAVYRKINLFDSQVPNASIRESDYYLAGQDPVMVTVHGVKVGIGICFDLRFPDVFRNYAKLGAQLIALPANFTAKTGIAHWEILLRARAIENLMYVAAPNQFGSINGTIPSYGNSMIVDPWGQVIDRKLEDKSGIIFADIDTDKVQNYRNQLPVL